MRKQKLLICLTILLCFGGIPRHAEAALRLSINRVDEPTRVVIDSAEITSLIAAEEKRMGDMKHNREDHPQTGDRFRHEMENAPSITIPGRTRAEVIRVSGARCGELPFETISFVKVRIIDKKESHAGTEGWICRETGHLPFERP